MVHRGAITGEIPAHRGYLSYQNVLLTRIEGDMKRLIIAITILLASANISWAACGTWSGNTVTAGACTTTEINACLNEITTSNVGEVTINLPSCNINSTDTTVINMNDAKYTNVTKLSIIGNGTIPTGSTKGAATSGGSTIARGTSSNYAFLVTGTTSKKFRLANITFTGGATSNALIRINGTSKPSLGGGFRLDHLTMSSIGYGQRGIWIDGNTYGVIDHLSVTTGYQFALVKDGVPGGNLSWHTAISFGGDNVYFEDNEVTGTSTTKRWMFCDGVKGARIVARYNTITNLYIGPHDAASGADGRGNFSYVAYNNTLVQTLVSSADPPFFLRGGTYIVYNNTSTITGGSIWGSPILLQNDRSMIASDGTSVGAGVWDDICDTTHRKVCLGTTYWTNAYCTTDANCGGESGACQNMDLAEDATGYPCRDQIGMSYTTSYTHYPSLFWNNTHQGTYTAPVVRSYNYVTDHIKNDRDFCHHATTMPATCGGHATTYSAYTYPHPLVNPVADTTNPNDLTSLSPTGQQACATNPSNVAISLSATDNVAVTGVRCCLENGSTCTSATAYASRGVVLSNTSGTTWGTTVSSACDTDIAYNCMSTDGTNYSNNGVISYQMANNSDTTAPTMSTQAIGADGRTVTFTFSEAVTIGAGGSAGFTLTNGDSEEISLTYVSGAGSDTLTYQTSVCVPSTDTFTSGLVYTQPTNGIEDMAGNDLASFSGAGAKTVTNGSSQSCDLATSLFEHGESAPSGSTNASGNAVNLGVKFQTSTAATMTHCWFYKIAADTGTHTCTVYRVLDGSTVGTVDFADESESGWQDQAFASALNIAANEDYIVTVSHPTGNWTSNVDYFASTYTNGNLTATTAGTDYPGRYVYGASMAYPTNDSARNYWTDFTMSYAGVGGPWQCTVSRTGDGCMITGSQVVTNGNTCSATVTLRNGWKATWGGTCPAGSETGGIYTTGNLSADCTVVAACTEQGILP